MPSEAKPSRPVEPTWDVRLVEERRRQSEQALWGVPGISLAAQAFLFSTGLDPSAAAPARLLVGVIGLISAAGTAVVVAGQGARLGIMRSWLAERTSMGSARLLRRELNKPLDRLTDAGDRLFVSPVLVWLVLLTAFAVADLVVTIAALVEIAGGGDLFGPG